MGISTTVMIQRIQTIWLALAAACGFSMAKLPLFTATLPNAGTRNFLASESLLVFALIIAIAAMSFVAIFLFGGGDSISFKSR